MAARTLLCREGSSQIIIILKIANVFRPSHGCLLSPHRVPNTFLATVAAGAGNGRSGRLAFLGLLHARPQRVHDAARGARGARVGPRGHGAGAALDTLHGAVSAVEAAAGVVADVERGLQHLLVHGGQVGDGGDGARVLVVRHVHQHLVDLVNTATSRGLIVVIIHPAEKHAF